MQDERADLQYSSDGSELSDTDGWINDDSDSTVTYNNFNNLGSDLTLGEDVGVTLRCSILTPGIGIVSELCSAKTVTAALCVQRRKFNQYFSDMFFIIFTNLIQQEVG